MANPDPFAIDPATQAQLQAMATGAPPPPAPGLAGPVDEPPPVTPPGPVASYAPPPAPVASVEEPVSKQAPPGSIAFAPAARAGAPGAGPALALGGVNAPRMQQVPAAWVPHSRETQSGIALSPETQDALRRYTQAGADVDDSLRAGFEAQQKIDRAAAEANAKQAAADLAEFQARKQRQDTERAKMWSKVQDAQEALNDAQTQGIDPDRWMHSRTTSQRTALIVGAMLNGFANPGGSNSTIDLITHEIDRDVEAQKASLAGKEKSLEGQMSLYGLMRQKGMDEDTAADGAKLLAHQQLDAQLKAALPDAQNALGKLTLQKAIEENNAKMVQLRAAIDEKVSSRSSMNEAYRPAATVGGIDDAMRRAIGEKQVEIVRQYPGTSMDAAFRLAVIAKTGRDPGPGMGPGSGIVQAPKGGASGARGLAKGAVANKANIAALDELGTLANETVLGPQQQARAAQLLATLKANGVEGLPQDSTMLSRIAGSTQAAIAQAKKDQMARLSAAQEISASGMGAGGEETEREAPEGFEEE